jgi:NitT/TauT family transport system ATP-binding protein
VAEVAENVAFHLKLKGVARSERRDRAQAFIDLVGLKGFEEHYPSELSGGMSQRVGIARALIMNPRVILMDEPFAALDAQTREEMQEELVAIWQRQHGTIVFVTHSVDEALVLGNRIVVMTRRPGRIREVVAFDLPRPRDVTGAEFNDMKRHLLNVIRRWPRGRRLPDLRQWCRTPRLGYCVVGTSSGPGSGTARHGCQVLTSQHGLEDDHDR